jgi:hypothetical protein
LSLLELSLSLLLGFALAGGAGLDAARSMETARARRTLADMAVVLEVCRQYEAAHGIWPGSLDAVREIHPGVPQNNVWADPYILGSEGGRVWIETAMPPGLAGVSAAAPGVVVEPLGARDRVRLSAVRACGPEGRLVYDKRSAHAP